MNKNNVDRLIKLRKFLIDYYETLDGGQNPSSAVAMQRDIAAILESSIKSVDEILSDYVSFN